MTVTTPLTPIRVVPVDPLPAAVDPPNCGCTECITGEYRPLNLTTHLERSAMILGHIRDNTGMSFAELYRYLRENHPEDFDADQLLIAGAA